MVYGLTITNWITKEDFMADITKNTDNIVDEKETTQEPTKTPKKEETLFDVKKAKNTASIKKENIVIPKEVVNNTVKEEKSNFSFIDPKDLYKK